MKKIKRSEVPAEYRKDHKKDFVELLKLVVLCVIFVLFVAWMFLAA
jgi:hypothetical protein